jgi:predicted aspartyl protease
MGIVYSEITLKNAADIVRARDGLIPEQQVRTAAVTAMVDTGAGTIIINEEIRQKLGLVIKGLRQATLAPGKAREPVSVSLQNKLQCKSPNKCDSIDQTASGLADGVESTYQVTEPVEIHWEDRDTACLAIVIPNADKILLGAIPLEDMDLIVDPKRQQLVGAHGNKVVCLIK